MKRVLILCLLCGLGFGQSSHRNLTTELLKNLYKAMADSTGLSRDGLNARFVEESTLNVYLNSCLPENLNGEDEAGVEIASKNFTLSIDHDSTKTVRNSGYLRQLELNVLFSYEHTAFVWRGKISDHLSKAQLKSLLEEDVPFEVGGNYAVDEPPIFLIGLTTAGVFALGAALFFIRT